MVSTRRAHASATPPSTPSAERHNHTPSSAPGSSKRMTKELRRLTIDANPSLGGLGSSSSASSSSKRSRRSAMRQEVSITHDDQTPELVQTEQPQGQGQEDQAPHPLLPDRGLLLTPSPSDSPNSPRPRPAASHASPPAVAQPCTLAQTSNPQPPPSTTSPLPAVRSIGKRKITQYFSAVPSQLNANKRRKIEAPHAHLPALQNVQNVTEPPATVPAPIPTTVSAPDPAPVAAPEQKKETPEQVDEKVAEPVAEASAASQQAKEPDKPQDTDHEQVYMTAEEKDPEPEKTGQDEKRAARRERELKRLQIDAKPALIGKQSRRQTTLPPAPRDDRDADDNPAKRQRLSLPVAPPGEVVSVQELLATPPEPNPPTFPAGTDPKLLASGEVNDKWLTKWLGYVAHITGDEDTSRILTEEDAKELIRPDRSHESDKDRHKRISKEMDVIAGWDLVAPQEAVQSSPEQPPVQRPQVKKKKPRFNPKPKGQPWIPKAKRIAMEKKEDATPAEEKIVVAPVTNQTAPAVQRAEAHTQAPAPQDEAAVKKQKPRVRFNPKPKGQPWFPKGNKAAKAKQQAKTAVNKGIEAAQEAKQDKSATADAPAPAAEPKQAERVTIKEAEAAHEDPQAKAAERKKEMEASTDWLTDLMNSTETVTPEIEQVKKSKKDTKGKGKAKVV